MPKKKKKKKEKRERYHNLERERQLEVHESFGNSLLVDELNLTRMRYVHHDGFDVSRILTTGQAFCNPWGQVRQHAQSVFTASRANQGRADVGQ